MEIEQEIIKKRELQSLVLRFIESDDDEENFKSLAKFIIDTNISKNKIDLQDLINLLLKIKRNHYRKSNFFTKILQIFKFISTDIQSLFTKKEIGNKLQLDNIIALLLIQNNLLSIDKDFLQTCAQQIINIETQKSQVNPYYVIFLYYYFKSNSNSKKQAEIEDISNKLFHTDLNGLQKLCQTGENESYMCQLIREDSINEFICYVNQNEVDLNSKIQTSLFETNEFLINQTPTLIEYAAFFGSIQIFKYLLKSEVILRIDLLEYCVHGRNSEIIHIIEENSDKLVKKQDKFLISFLSGYLNKKKTSKNEDFKSPLFESIKCFHNEIAYYIIQNKFDEIHNDGNGNDNHEIQIEIYKNGLINNNYEFISDNFIDLFPVQKYPLIDDSVFQIFLALTKITLPNSITDVADNIFNNFTKLEEVVISSSVISIGKNSFRKCTSLKKVTFSNPSSLASIGESAFSDCSSLIEIQIPSSVNSIEMNSFKNCKSLKTLALPSSITSISKCTFINCSSLDEISIPSSIKEIGVHAFEYCSSLKQISIPSSIDSIKSYTFAGCSSLSQVIIPSSVTSIKKSAFSECSSLVKIMIPSSVTSIGDYAFENCTSLEQINIPPFVTYIGCSSFRNCSSLVELTIPSLITSIENGLFENCISLKQVAIPSSVTQIGNYSFRKCISLTVISLPSSITSIGTCAFEECSLLSQITIPSSISIINNFTFSECTSLKQIEIPSSVNEIADFAFNKCSSLEQIIFQSSVTKISDNAFNKCVLLQTNLPNNSENKDEIQKLISKSKEIYQNIFNYLESSENIDDNLRKLILKSSENEYDLIELLNLLSRISTDHNPIFINIFEKIEAMIDICKENIKQKLTNNKICHIFRNNKRILLYLIENKIINFNKSTLNIIINKRDYECKNYNYNDLIYKYFEPEIIKFEYQQSEDLINEHLSKLPKDFELNRKIGQNEAEICQIIRKDSLDEFISYLKDNKIDLNSKPTVPFSVFETNEILYFTKFIEYSAFYGSLQIFNYLLKKELEKENNQDMQYLWNYAIFGNQIEIIHKLEKHKTFITSKCDNEIFSLNFNFDIENCIENSLKCHNIKIINYIITNYSINNKLSDIFYSSIKYSNYLFIEKLYNNCDSDDILLLILYYLCLNDYPKLAEFLIQYKNIEINKLSKQTQISDKLNKYQNDPSIFTIKFSDKYMIINAIVESNITNVINNLIKNKLNIFLLDRYLLDIISNENIELLKICLAQNDVSVNKIHYDCNYYLGKEKINIISPLILAILIENVEIVELLLKYPTIDVNLCFGLCSGRAANRTPLHIAIAKNNIQIVKLLLNHPRIDVNVMGNFDEKSDGFIEWCSNDHIKADHFDLYFTPLHEAVELDNLEIVNLLLKNPKININKIEVYDNYFSQQKKLFDRVRQTALLAAIRRRNFDMVKLLLDQPNININQVSIYCKNDDVDPTYIIQSLEYHNNFDVAVNNFNEEETTFDVDENDDEFNIKKLTAQVKKIKYKKTILQLAYASKSQNIIQLIQKREDIQNI